MPDPTQFNLDPIRVALDHGEVVELAGGTLVLGGEESPSVVLRLAPWRARSVARVLQEWSSVSRIFRQASRSHLDELELSRTLELAAAALGDLDESIIKCPPRFPARSVFGLLAYGATSLRRCPISRRS